MGTVILEMLPVILGAAIVPIWIIIVLFLLRGEKGLPKALAFVAGISAVRVAEGLVFGYIFNSSKAASSDSGSSTIVSTLLLVIGILLLITAFKVYQKEDDPDGPPPKWMQIFSTATPLKAFLIGAVLVAVAAKQWVFALSAIATIGAAQLSQIENILAFLIYVLLTIALPLIPIVMYAASPQRSAVTLERMGKWLEVHNRQIVIAVSLIFGVFFLLKGLTGLLG